jgi:hypothetical protein
LRYDFTRVLMTYWIALSTPLLCILERINPR